jgi:hypothetical protein
MSSSRIIERMRALALVAVAAVAAVTLSSCVTIPTHGGVLTGDPQRGHLRTPKFAKLRRGQAVPEPGLRRHLGRR